MGIFRNMASTFDNLRNTAREYVETQIELLKLEAARRLSALFATMAAYAILILFLLFFLLFASVACAYVLSDIIGRTYAGFLIVGGIYLVIGFIIFLGRERILRKPFLNAIIRQLFKDTRSNGNASDANTIK